MNHLPLSTRRPDEPVAWHQGQMIALSLLLGRAEHLAERLPAFTYAINLCRDRHVFSIAFAATIIAGGTNLLPANRLPHTLAELIRDHPGTIVISDEAIEPADCPVIDAAPVLASTRESSHIPQVPTDHLAAIVFTSGSTGPSSRIHKPWRTLFESSRINADGYALARPYFALATVPPQHMWGLETSVLMSWFAPQITSSSQPFFSADLISELGALPESRALISTPVHLRALAESGLELPETALILSSTAPLSADLAARLEAASGANVVEIYGCSETGCLAKRRTSEERRWRFLHDFDIRCEGDNTWVCAAKHLPEPVRLMDQLQIDSDGRFRLIGRKSDLVNIAGKRASLSELTQALVQIPGVVDGVIFQPPETGNNPVRRLAALVVAPNQTSADVRRHLATRVDAAFIPRPLRLVDALPREESGKLPLTSVFEMYRRGCKEVQ